MSNVIQDRNSIIEAYMDVRNDNTTTNWCCLKYDGKTIGLDSCGESFEDLKSKFQDDERVYTFLRVQTGDEMSKRMKFAFIVWVGPGISALKKGKVSTDKAFVKEVFMNFAVEMLIDDIHEAKEEKIKAKVRSAGGANYGTGQ